VCWKSIKRLWSSALAAVEAVAEAIVVVEVSIAEAEDNQVVKVDVAMVDVVAVVGNNSDAALEAEATVVAAEVMVVMLAVVKVVVLPDEAGVLDAEEHAHKKKRGIQ
jgi:hypothetical protein